MFGYVKPFVPELKIKENEAFKGVYCGLCKQLGRSFGFWARMTLNYDFVFLAMLYYAGQEEMPNIEKGRCCINPLAKVPMCQSDNSMKYSADVAIIMIHHKIKDNILDNKGIKQLGWRIGERFTRKSWRKATERQNKAEEIISEMMARQKAVQQTNTSSIDQACEPTAWALSQLICQVIKEDNPNLKDFQRFGYLLGRYIYMCDALEDIRWDIKHNDFNPFVNKYISDKTDEHQINQAIELGKAPLYMTIGEMERMAEDLKFKFFSPIINNILTYGMQNSVNQILIKEGANNEQP